MDFGSHALNAPQDHDTLQTFKCKYESLHTTSPDSEEQTTERAPGLRVNKKIVFSHPEFPISIVGLVSSTNRANGTLTEYISEYIAIHTCIHTE